MRYFYLQIVSRNLFIVGSFGTVLSTTFSSEKHVTSKVKLDILEIFILRFDLLYFDVKNFVARFYIHKLYCIYFLYQFFWLQITCNFKNQDRTRLFGKVEEETVWKIWRGRFGYPAFSVRTVDSWGEEDSSVSRW